MKRLLLLASLALAGCAPLVAAPAVDPGTGTLTITKAAAYQVVSFGSGTQDATGVKLTLSGVNLAVNDPTCLPVQAQLVCGIGTVGAGRTYVLPARGVLVVQAEYQRPDGRTYTLAAD